jgi:hypothetical protein
MQSWIWGAGFGFFALCCAICAWQAHRFATPQQQTQPLEESLSPTTQASYAPLPRWLWFVLPMLGSAMLLATTNLVTQEVAPIPLLWVLPLCAYLLSFILTFDSRNWYRRPVMHPLFAITTLVAVVVLFPGTGMSVLPQILVFLAALFSACLVCHGELALLKPEVQRLTSFYLALSAGGACGGIFVGIIAPLIFPAIWEYHIALWMVALLLGIILFLDKKSWLHAPKPDLLVPVGLVGLLFLLPKCLARVGMMTIPVQFAAPYSVGIIVLLSICAWLAFTGGPNWLRHRKFRFYELTISASILLLTAALYIELTSQRGRVLYRERNFYGALSVRENWDTQMLNRTVELMHGRITHGLQFERTRKLPTSYYDKQSGVGLALTTIPQRAAGPLRVGVIGLGVGTVTAYAQAGDVYRFYEINPAVVRLAQGQNGYFTFLRDSPGRVEIAPGDARLSLEAEALGHDFRNFDVLIVDAFNGDSIPIHLLTREAMALYLSHMRGPESIIAIHISNRAVDLGRVVARFARSYQLQATLVSTDVDNGLVLPSDWILLSRGSSLNVPEIARAGHSMRRANQNRNMAMWTDDYSNLVSLLVR